MRSFVLRSRERLALFCLGLLFCARLFCDVVIAPRGIVNTSYVRQMLGGRTKDIFTITKMGRAVVHLSEFSLPNEHDIAFKPYVGGPDKQLMLVKSASVVRMDTGSNMYIGDDSGKHLVTVISSPGFTLSGGVFARGADLLLTDSDISEGAIIATRDDAKIFMLNKALNDNDVQALSSHNLGSDFTFTGSGDAAAHSFVATDIGLLLMNGQGVPEPPSGQGSPPDADEGNMQEPQGSGALGSLSPQGYISNPDDGMLVPSDDDEEEEETSPLERQQRAAKQLRVFQEVNPQPQEESEMRMYLQMAKGQEHTEAPQHPSMQPEQQKLLSSYLVAEQGGSQPPSAQKGAPGESAQEPEPEISQDDIIIQHLTAKGETLPPSLRSSTPQPDPESQQQERQNQQPQSGDIVSPDAQRLEPAPRSQPPLDHSAQQQISPSEKLMRYLAEKERAQAAQSAPEIESVTEAEEEEGAEEPESLNVESPAQIAPQIVTKEDVEDVEFPDVAYKGEGFDEIEGVGLSESEELDALKRDARRNVGRA